MSTIQKPHLISSRFMRNKKELSNLQKRRFQAKIAPNLPKSAQINFKSTDKRTAI